jgi:glycosyltransferase involved in cell wall biosynthesis
VIIVDDGSCAPVIASPSVARTKQSQGQQEYIGIASLPMVARNDSTKIIRQENGGAPSARNRGLKEAIGDYIIFWDADVIAKPDMLEKMLNCLHDNPSASFAYSNYYFGFKKMQGQQFNSLTIRQLNYIHSTSLIRRADVIQWDDSLKRFQDWDYWLTLAEQGKKGVWIDEYLFKVMPGGTMSSWLPSFAYKKPWSLLPIVGNKVKKYNDAREIIFKKHQL